MQVRLDSKNSMAFGSVTPIIASTKGKAQLEKALASKKGKYLLEDLTDLYLRNANSNGVLSKASKAGKKILFLITGKEYDASMYMHHGWVLLQLQLDILIEFQEKLQKTQIILFHYLLNVFKQNKN